MRRDTAQPGSARPGAPITGELFDIIFDAPGAAEDILGFFEHALVDRGWSVADIRRPAMGGGFEMMRMAPSRTFCRSPRGPSLSVRVLPVTAGTNDVRIHIDTASPGPCATPPGGANGHASWPSASAGPFAPAGVFMEGFGGGGSESHWTSNATAETDTRLS